MKRDRFLEKDEKELMEIDHPSEQEEEADLQSATKNPHVEQILIKWKELNAEQRKQYLGPNWALLPQDLQRAIFQLRPEIIMKMALVHPLFRVIARMDSVWQVCYYRDFPAEYALCNQRLPIFVMGKGRILSRIGEVASHDKPAWKRFYMNTAHLYHRMTRRFDQQYQLWLPERLAVRTATALEERTWARRYIFGHGGALYHEKWEHGQRPWYSYRAKVAWAWVSALAWFTSPQEVRDFSTLTVVRRFWMIFGADAKYAWTCPYLIFGLNSYRNISLERATRMWMDDSVTWAEFLVRFMPEITVDVLFAAQDWDRWTQLIETVPLLLNPEKHSAARAYMKGLLLMCRRTVENPCLFSLFDSSFLYMCLETVQIENEVEDILTSLGNDAEDFVHMVRSLPNEAASDFILERWSPQEYALRYALDFRHRMRSIKRVGFDDTFTQFFTTGPGSWQALNELFAEFATLPRFKLAHGQTGPIKYIAQPLMMCGQCANPLDKKTGKQCGAQCGRALYCNQQCADAHWLTHKRECERKK